MLYNINYILPNRLEQKTKKYVIKLILREHFILPNML